MEQTTHAVLASPEITFPHEPAPNAKKKIWATFWILLVLTIAELALGLSHYAFHIEGVMLTFVKGLMIILSVAKAVYIVSVFMHLGEETRNFKLLILVPMISFVWFIFAFLRDGVSYKDLRNRYNGPAPTEQVAPPPPAQKPGGLN